jgi:hypothetical protein
LLLAVAVAGCGKADDDPPPTENPPPDSGTPVDSGTPLRKVERRNPLGRTEIAENLLVDGDFEITGRTGQPPWYAFDRGGQETLNFDTGGRCYSGVRCALLTAGQTILGFIASPKSGGMLVSIMIKPKSGLCSDGTVSVTDLDDTSRTISIKSESENADDSGWCRFAGTAPNYARKAPVLYIEADGDILVDAGEVTPAPTGQSMPLSVGLPPRATTLVGIEAASAWIRSHRIFGRPPAPSIEGPPLRGTR